MGKISKSISAAIQRAKGSPTYWTERVKLAFAVALEQRRKAMGLSYSDLAKRIGSSPAYVTKVFRGDSNLTIESMVKLAFATGSELDIRVVAKVVARPVWDVDRIRSSLDSGQNRVTATGSTVTVVDFSARRSVAPVPRGVEVERNAA